jgi:RimJ/RimL family protein N-acetyltransferase
VDATADASPPTPGAGLGTRRPYPSHLESDVVLRDGSTVHVRPVRPEDEGAILEFLRRLSAESRYFRFFSGSVNLQQAARTATDVDHRWRFGLVATAGGADHVVAHAVYLSTGPDRAEVAFAIADAYQGRGLGTILLGQLAEEASQNGVHVFEARVLPQNHGMIQVFRDSGFPVEVRSELGERAVEFPTSLGEEALERF